MKKRSAGLTVDTSSSWHALYQAALFETDRKKLPERIEAAEKAIEARVNALYGTKNDHIEEDLVLDDALYALRALRNCPSLQSNVA